MAPTESAATWSRDEELRLRTLYAYDVLDTVEEQSFDEICQIAAALCQTPTALITLVDRRRQWFKARYNFSEKETERECSFCARTIEKGQLMVIANATRDGRFEDNRLVVSKPHIRFYAGMPVFAANGQQLGTVCAIDYQPRELSEEQSRALRALARQVEIQLELRRIQHDKELLSRFVVHDMRNPLTGMLSGTELALRRVESGELPEEVLTELQQSAELLCRRVEDFHNLMADESGALPMKLEAVDLDALIGSLEGSLRRALSIRRLRLETNVEVKQVWADEQLLRRILENLLYNAMPVAPPDSALTIETDSTEGEVRIRVLDEGPGVPEGERKSIFETYKSLRPNNRRASTGLGLAFCAMASRAMGGTVVCEPPPSGRGACFRVTLPASGPA